MLSSVVSKSLTRPGSTCGPTWTAAPGPVVGRSNARQALDVAARLDVRTDLDGGSRPGGRALERCGRSLYEIGRDSGGAPYFLGLPPGPAFGSARGGSRRGGSLRAVARFFCTTFSGGGFSDDEPAVLRNAG